MPIHPNPQEYIHHQKEHTHKIHFNIKKHVKFGQAIYVCGNIQQLGSWNPQRALRLNWNYQDIWNGQIVLSNDILVCVEYKYIIANWESPSQSQITWQIGGHNRRVDIQAEQSFIICNNRWNMDRIWFNVQVPKSKSNSHERYYISGSIYDLGNWKQKRLMKKNIKKNILNNQKKRYTSEGSAEYQYSYYTYSIQIFRAQAYIQYSYLKQQDTLQAQRIPNRILDLNQKETTSQPRLHIAYPRGQILVADQCKISQLHYSRITHNLFIGSYIRNYSDFQLLKTLQVTSILSLQTDKDLKRHGISNHFLHLLSREFQISYRRYPIEDMNSQDFVIKADNCLKLLHHLLTYPNSIVYIHCSAGIFRSPQMAALYMCIYEGRSSEQAVNQILKVYPQSKANLRIIDASLRVIGLKKYIKKNINLL